MQRTQVAIVGGGPAGLAAALEAKRRGLDAIVLERESGVIDKACGEGLMPAALQSLRELGVRDLSGIPFRGIRYRDATLEDLTADGDFPAEPGLGVRRTTLHAALRQAALAAGCEIVDYSVREVREDADGVVIDHTLRADWLIAADGLHSKVRRQLGLDRPAKKKQRFGMRRHFPVAPWTDRVEVYWGNRGEAYVTPVADDLVGVAFLFRPPARYDELLAEFPVLADHLAGTSPETSARGAGAFAQRARAVQTDRVFLVGDAAGYVDAITGEGIAIAVESARAAIAAIADGRPHSYSSERRRLTRQWEWTTRGLLAMTRPRFVHRPLIKLLGAVPTIFDRALRVLAEPAR